MALNSGCNSCNGGGHRSHQQWSCVWLGSCSVIAVVADGGADKEHATCLPEPAACPC